MRRRLEASDPGELDLVPLMNLVVCLVPLVLLGANLTPVGVIESEGPRFCTSCGQGDHSPSLNLMVHLGEDVIRVSALGDATLSEHPAELAADDDAGLYRLLAELKDRFPRETLVTVTADQRVPYRRVVAALDTMRLRLDGPVPDRASLSRTPPALDDRGRPALLFPDVSFAAAQ
ncbi:MAG: biopolymer transporter ExbD [bacterium]